VLNAQCTIYRIHHTHTCTNVPVPWQCCLRSDIDQCPINWCPISEWGDVRSQEKVEELSDLNMKVKCEVWFQKKYYVRSQIFGGRQLKSLIRPLSRATSSRDKANPLAARPNVGNRPFVDAGPECDFSILGRRVVQLETRIKPRAEEFRLKMSTTAQISKSFHWSPRTWQIWSLISSVSVRVGDRHSS